MQKRRPLRGPSEHLQIAVQLLQAAAHGQQLAAVVQRHVRQSSGLSQHAGGKTLKAEHLRITAGRGAAGAAQIQLRLMGSVLRHQQQLRAVLPLPGHGLQHTGGFAASRASDPDGQHGGCPPHKLMVSYVRFMFYYTALYAPWKVRPEIFLLTM